MRDVALEARSSFVRADTYLVILTIMFGINSTEMRNRTLLRAGLLGAPLFILSLIVFGRLNPGYSHAHSAVSRLGAFGAPMFWVFDMVGLFLPGLFIAGVAVELRRAEAAREAVTWSSGGLIAFGLMQSLTAIPADFQRMFQSPWTLAHTFFITIPVLLFFAVIPGCGGSLLRLGALLPSVRLFTLLGYLPIAEFLLYGVAKDSPGLVQRLMIITVHASSAWLAWVLIRTSRDSATPTSKRLTSLPAKRETIHPAPHLPNRKSDGCSLRGSGDPVSSPTLCARTSAPMQASPAVPRLLHSYR